MAPLVRHEVTTSQKPSRIIIGKQIIEIITSGMYSNALMVLREYVQNAADAIDAAVEQGLISTSSGRIDIDLDGGKRTIRITDNGTGVSAGAAEEVLCALGHSTKPAGSNRGFRGIGRLGGLGYCDRLVFETRAAGEDRVTMVTWGCQELKKILSGERYRRNVSDAVRKVATLQTRQARPDDPAHFFRVSMHDVHRFHKDELMNIPAMKTYLAEVTPVGFDPSRFPYAKKVESHLSELDGYRAYDIRLNGMEVVRPHSQVFPISGAQQDEIHDVELFDVKRPNGDVIGKGWYACTNYQASLPPSVSMRGIRLRQGNIEVGDEYSLAEAFSERRFATWHIGEIHFNYAMKANARRDGFEQTPDYETFLEHATRLGKHLSNLCRTSSKQRTARVIQERRLRQVEELLGRSIIVDEHHFAEVREQAGVAIEELTISAPEKEHPDSFYQRLADAKAAFERFVDSPPYLRRSLDGRSLRCIGPKELLESVAKQIVAEYHPDKSAEQLVADVMAGYMRPSSRNRPG